MGDLYLNALYTTLALYRRPILKETEKPNQIFGEGGKCNGKWPGLEGAPFA
jgi:hypothetical protein